METAIDKQKEFETKICELFKFTGKNIFLLQRDESEQMIIDDFNGIHSLSGTLAYNRTDKSFLLIATKDSEVNHIEAITFKMIKLLIRDFCGQNKNRVTLATNLPIEIHSDKAKDLKRGFNFHIQNIGYSFCLKHNLEYTEMY